MVAGRLRRVVVTTASALAIPHTRHRPDVLVGLLRETVHQEAAVDPAGPEVGVVRWEGKVEAVPASQDSKMYSIRHSTFSYQPHLLTR